MQATSGSTWIKRTWFCAAASVGFLFLLFVVLSHFYARDILSAGQAITLLDPGAAGNVYATGFINAALFFLSLFYVLARTDRAKQNTACAHTYAAIILTFMMNFVLLINIAASVKAMPIVQQQIQGADNQLYYLLRTPTFKNALVIVRRTGGNRFILNTEIVYWDYFNSWRFRNEPISHSDPAVRQAAKALYELQSSR